MRKSAESAIFFWDSADLRTIFDLIHAVIAVDARERILYMRGQRTSEWGEVT